MTSQVFASGKTLLVELLQWRNSIVGLLENPSGGMALSPEANTKICSSVTGRVPSEK